MYAITPTHPPQTHREQAQHQPVNTHTCALCVYLQWNVPGHVDVILVLVHPDLSHPQSVTAHVGGQVLCVGLVGTLDVCNPGAGQHLNASAALPHLCRTKMHTRQ